MAKNNIAKRVSLQIGIHGETNVEIVKGLHPKDKVILDGNHRLVQNTPVMEVK